MIGVHPYFTNRLRNSNIIAYKLLTCFDKTFMILRVAVLLAQSKDNFQQ